MDSEPFPFWTGVIVALALITLVGFLVVKPKETVSQPTTTTTSKRKRRKKKKKKSSRSKGRQNNPNKDPAAETRSEQVDSNDSTKPSTKASQFSSEPSPAAEIEYDKKTLDELDAKLDALAHPNKGSRKQKKQRKHKKPNGKAKKPSGQSISIPQEVPTAQATSVVAEPPMHATVDDGGGWSTISSKKRRQPRRKVEAPTTIGTDTIKVQKKKVSLIIGSKGITIQAIREKSGAKVDVAGGDSNTSDVQVTGDNEARAVAKAIIKDITTMGFSAKLKPGMQVRKVAFPKSLLPLLRGSRFAAIRNIEKNLDVKLHIPDEVNPKAVNVKLKVGGSKAAIEKVKSELTNLAKYYHSKASHPGMVHKEVRSANIGLVCGHKGQNIKSIQGDTKAKIYTPKPGLPNPNIVIVGTKSQVEKAFKQVNKILGRGEGSIPSPSPKYESDYDDEVDDVSAFYHVSAEDLKGFDQ